jgi:hypothetical protein
MSDTEQTPQQRTEAELTRAVMALADLAPSRVLPALARALEGLGCRVLFAAVGLTENPQVTVTVTVDDVTSEVVKQVAVPILLRAGIGPEAVPMFANMAGGAVSRWLRFQREAQARRAAQQGGSGA